MNDSAANYAVIPHSRHVDMQHEVARLLHCDHINIRRDAFGRPFLVNNPHDVNWSHSGEWLAVAWSCTQRVGVDIERVRPRARWLEIAERFFAQSEVSDLRNQNSLMAFLQLWCLKEAVMKAHGHGISYGLEKVVFVWRDGWTLQRLPPDMGANWEARLMEVPEGYVGALAWCDR